MRIFGIAILGALASACTPASLSEVPNPDSTLPFFGDGYPTAGDPCRKLGESEETIDYLDHTADLVACPATMEGLEDLRSLNGATEAFHKDGYVVLSIPRSE